MAHKDAILIVCKLGGAALLFFGMLNYRVQEAGEQILDPYFQNYLDTDIVQADTDIVQADTDIVQASLSRHNAAASLEDKITFNNIDDQQQAEYIEKIDSSTSFIDSKNTINPDFSHTIKKIEINEGKGKRRGYATRNNIVFNLHNVNIDQEFPQLTTHELAHIFDLGFMQGDAEKTSSRYTEFNKSVFATDDPSLLYYALSRQDESTRKATASKSQFCSVYAMSDPFEDFAECFNLYLRHNALFKIMAKKDSALAKKYNFIATLFGGKYISSDTKNLLLLKQNSARRTRDTTKITSSN